MKYLLIVVAAICLTSCFPVSESSKTETEKVQYYYVIQQYSGGIMVNTWNGKSEYGYVSTNNGGYVYFTDMRTGNEMMASGDLVIECKEINK